MGGNFQDPDSGFGSSTTLLYTVQILIPKVPSLYTGRTIKRARSQQYSQNSGALGALPPPPRVGGCVGGRRISDGLERNVDCLKRPTNHFSSTIRTEKVLNLYN